MQASIFNNSVPDLDNDFTLPGLDGDVEIYRDSYGIPHVVAKSTSDAYFAQGFVTAQDRLWQMDYDRLRGSGRWAEVMGISALENDKTIRRLGLLQSAKEDYAAISSETKLLFDAYALGVNAYIYSNNNLPPEYRLCKYTPEVWSPWDGLIVYKIRHIFMGVFESKLWRYRMTQKLGVEKTALLFPGYEDDQPIILPPGSVHSGSVDILLNNLEDAYAKINPNHESDSGSNSWVLSGSRTTTGSPILAGDSHRALDTPNVYYQNHISCPEFDVIGLSFPGVPAFPHFGHNKDVAWSVTHTFADYQDLYVEQFDQNHLGRYKVDDKWHSAGHNTELIKVKDHPDQTISVWKTQHGNVIAGEPKDGTAITLKYTATSTGSIWPETLHTMLTAQNVHELRSSMQDWVDPCNNFLMADIKGNIGYLCRGHIPIRPLANGLLPVPGWDSSHEWSSRIPFEELPSSINPMEGFIATANNKPVDDQYPYFIGADFAPGYRIQRINDLIKRESKHSLADMKNIQSEMISIPAQIYSKKIALLKTANPKLTQAQSIMRDWDAQMHADMVSPSIYSYLRDSLIAELLHYHMGNEMFTLVWDPSDRGRAMFLTRFKALVAEHIQSDTDTLLPSGLTWDQLFIKHLSLAIESLESDIGPEMSKWTWSSIHRAEPTHVLTDLFPRLSHALNPPPIPMSGDGDTPLAGSYAPAHKAKVTSLSVTRYAYDLSDWDKSLWSIPLGSSGIPQNEHYFDQSPMWQKLDMVPMYYNWDHIKKNSKHNQSLRVELSENPEVVD